MTILFISEHPHTQIGGIEKHVNHVGKVLKSKGIKARYLNAKELGNMSILDKQIVFKNIIQNKLLSVSPDVIHLHGFSSFFVNQCLSLIKKVLPDIKLIYTPHYHPFKYHKYSLLASSFFHLFLKKNFKNIDSLIALSQTEKEFFTQYINPDKINVIPNGIEIISSPNQKRKPKENTVLFVGRDDCNKRLDFLQEQKTYFKSHQIHCNIVTNKEEASDEIFTYYKNLSQIELEKLYQESSVLVVPSKYEAFSIVALEAISCGLPVLISDRVQIKSYLKNTDDFNIIFRYGVQSDFAKKLEMILSLDSTKYEQLSAENMEFSQSFDWNLIVDQLLSLYRR